MVDILASTRDEESRKRDEVVAYQFQQQMDELRRQLREVTARQQWLEDLYKNTEGQVVQLQMAQERHSQDVAQTLQVRQIEEGRLKQQVGELAQRVEEPLKPLRDMRAQIGELIDGRRQDRERIAQDLRQFEGLQGQIRQLVSQIGMIADAQRQLRDLVQALDSVNAETRQEIQRATEAQRLEEARMRRNGVELQQMVESLRAQVGEIAIRNVRIDDVRRQLLEQIETIRSNVQERAAFEAQTSTNIGRLEKLAIDHHAALQERIETVRGQFAGELTEVRQTGDQRMDRYIARFQQIEDRLRELDQRLADLPPMLEVLRRRDEELELAVDSVEERRLRDEVASLEAQIDSMRQRRTKKQAEAAQKANLVRSVRDARPHTGPVEPSPLPPDDEPS